MKHPGGPMSTHEQQSGVTETGPATPAALCADGFRLRGASRPLDAAQCCQRALSLDPSSSDAMHLMGLLSFDGGQYDHAIEWLARAIRQVPKAEYLKHLGAVLQHVKRYEEALKAFDKAIQFQPDSAELWCCIGGVFLQLGRDNEALSSYQRALQLTPDNFEAAGKGGVLLHRQGRWEEALAHFNICLALQPDLAPFLNLRAIAHRGLRNYQAYLSDSLRAHALDPTDAESCNNAGEALLWLGREEDAIAWFDKALALLPNNPTILTNKAEAMSQLRRLDEAAAIYSHVRTIAPDHAKAEWNLALLKLLTGDFAAGWPGRQARWKIPAFSAGYPKFREPMWRGEEVAGKTILIHVDEGLGDTILFARYAPMLAARGARVILVVHDALRPLLSGLAGVAQCLPLSARQLPPFDLHCPFSHLPMIFGTTLDRVPAGASYLPQPAAERMAAWEQRLGPRGKPRIGLAWSGSSTHANDQRRSIPLQMLARILDADATFVSLQKDLRPADKAALSKRKEIIDFTAQLTDFAETAALASCLDLVVTADTSVAHLAGAMGRPTWIVLPYVPDYRWLLDRDDSPWYPSVRLFRQDSTRDYAPVLDRVRAELAAFVTAFNAN
jgi:tetratricopeptide (TPR) repeat protein/ADP-heptose:LPS heptosyltransferase